MVRETFKRLSLYLLGLLVFLLPLKFIIPVVFIRFAGWPALPASYHDWVNIQEWIFGFWYNQIFYWSIGIVFTLAIWSRYRRGNPYPRWMLFIWVLFLLIQGASYFISVDKGVSRITLVHFIGLFVAFSLGALFSEKNETRFILWCFMAASIAVVLSGISQTHTTQQLAREYLKAHPELAAGNPDLIRKIQTKRMSATFMSPNMLGSYLSMTLLLICGMLFVVEEKLRRLWLAMLGLVCFYCLLKTESKGSWICLGLTMLFTALLFYPKCRKKALRVSAILMLGIIFLSAAGFGQRLIDSGSATWAARTQYWRAAFEIGKDHPFLGTGPGTFMVMYSKYKMQNEEYSRLVHNNYLQMWCDSGIPGLISFILILPGILFYTCRKLLERTPERDELSIWAWSACLFFTLHSLVDFDLYVLGTSWVVFLLLGSNAIQVFNRRFN